MQSNVIQERVPVHGDPGHWVHISQSPRHVRVIFGGETIASSKRAKLLREAEALPVYYFPKEDVRSDFFALAERTSDCPHKGTAIYYSIRVGAKQTEAATWSYPAPLSAAGAIKEHFAFEWPKMDKWMEEEEELYVHARDPYKRVDALPSARYVKVIVDGQLVAETRRPTLVFETNHPVRYYIPREDVRVEVLVPSATKSRCPYKGPASYWSVKLGGETFSDLVWGYMETIPECPKINGLVCFWHERGCEIYVDGELIEQPKTKWARPLRS